MFTSQPYNTVVNVIEQYLTYFCFSSSDEESSQVFIPFVSDVRVGADTPATAAAVAAANNAADVSAAAAAAASSANDDSPLASGDFNNPSSSSGGVSQPPAGASDAADGCVQSTGTGETSSTPPSASTLLNVAPKLTPPSSPHVGKDG